MTFRYRLLLCTLSLLVAASCARDDASPKPSLLDGEGGASGAAGAGMAGDGAGSTDEDDEPPSPDEEAARLREMQLIRVTSTNGESRDMTAEDLGEALQTICTGLQLAQNEIPEGQVSDQCWGVYPEVKCALTTASQLLEIANSAHTPFLLDTPGASTDDFTITPQSSGARHRAALVAARYVDKGTRISLIALQGNGVPATWLTNNICDTVCSCAADLETVLNVGPAGTTRVPQALGSRLVGATVEGYHLLKEAMQIAGDIGIAVADSQRSDTSSIIEATRRQMTADELSRSAAAHLLVGGQTGLRGQEEADFLCTVPQLSPTASRALLLMRESGLMPADISSSNTALEDLVDDDFRVSGSVGFPATICGSVRERLYQLWGDERFEDTDVSVPELFGLSMADFAEARDYLAREHHAFGRSGSAMITTGSCHIDGIGTGPYPIFAATASEPHDIAPIYWSAVARKSDESQFTSVSVGALPFFSAVYTEDGTTPDPISVPLEDRGGLSAILEEYVVRASRALKRLSTAGIDTPTEREMNGALNLLLADAQDERAGRLYAMRWQFASFEGTYYPHVTLPLLWGTAAGDGAVVVQGEDGLRCALYGNIEGAPCDDEDLDRYIVGELNRDYEAELALLYQSVGGQSPTDAAASARTMASGIPEGKAAWGVIDGINIENGVNLYVVKPRAGETPTSAGPGELTVLGAFQHRNTGHTPVAGEGVNLLTGRRDADVYSFIPELDRRVAEYLEPNKRWCSQPQISCAGTEFDARLPLENELTDDDDNKEDSWRHYLTLARQAADEADALGQEYLQTEVDRLSSELGEAQLEDQIRERRERELEELQNICGTSIASDKLYRMLFAAGDIGSIEPMACTNPADVSCETIHHGQCVSGVCVPDIQARIKAEAGTDPDFYRMYQCMAAWEGAEELAAAGDQEMCVVLGAGNRNRLCEYGDGNKLKFKECPVARGNSASCDDLFPLRQSGDTTALVTPLGYFKTTRDMQEGGSKPDQVCGAFRAARNYAAHKDAGGYEFKSEFGKLMLLLMRDNTFYFENVQSKADLIGWSATAPIGTMTFRDAPTYPRADGGWPCLSHYPSDAVETTCNNSDVPGQANSSFFCQQIDCQNPAQLGAWSNRAFWATVALRAMAYRGRPSKLDFAMPGAGTFSPVVPLKGVDVLAYNKRPVRNQSSLRYAAYAPFAPTTVESWRTPGDPMGEFTKLVITPYAVKEVGPLAAPAPSSPDHWIFDVQGLTNLPLSENFDSYGYDATGGIIHTHVGNDGILQIAPGEFAQHYEAKENRYGNAYLCSASSMAPEWWLGLSYDDYVLYKHARMKSLGANDTWQPVRNEEGWIAKYLQGSDDVADINGLWASSQPAPCVAMLSRKLQEQIPFDVADDYRDSEVGTSLMPTEHKNQLLGEPTAPDDDKLWSMVLQPPSEPGHINQAVLDAAEIFCHFQNEHDQPPQLLLDHPPPFRGLDDLDDAAEWFRTLATSLNDRGRKLVFAGMPKQAVDALSLNPINSAYPGLGGELAKAITDLRGALVVLSSAAPGIANQVQSLAKDIEMLQNRMTVLNVRAHQLDIRQLAESMQRSSDCAAAIMPSFTQGASFSVTVNTGAIAICANAFAQIGFSAQLTNLDLQINAKDVQLELEQFGKLLIDRRDAMRQYAELIITANEDINGNLAVIDGLKAKARRAVSRALFMQSDLAQKQERVSGAMRARTYLARERYRRALMNAQRVAFVAKRAVEQRLGVHLSELREDFSLVEAPSTWESRVCTTTGVDFQTFEDLAEEGEEAADLEAFADRFIGDYVTKLENVVESYPLDNNFHEGHDTAVVSMRDDLLDARVMCEMDTGNLLYHSGNLGQIEYFVDDASSLRPDVRGWALEGCARDDEEHLLRDCISVATVRNDGPLELASTEAQSVSFGDTGAVCDYANAADPDRCGYTETAVLRQDVLLEPGTYLLSWYAKGIAASANLLRVRGNGGTFISGTTNEVPGATGMWRRHYTTFEVPNQTTVSVVLRQPSGAPANVLIAATMLENLTGLSDIEPPLPKAYVATMASRTRTVQGCKDLFGESFPSHWTYRCANLCPNGFGAACPSDESTEQCYYERAFSISQRDIERGVQLTSAGFAKGNFNYRIESVALNFVGTGTRDCENEPDSCYGGGFIPYSISHDGPYIVRNYQGEDYEASLFPGWIEHARGLAAERVITNPISSADRSLLQDYRRVELRGRPLDGLFTVRVWDEPGVNFAAVDDIQLVVDYRYWTRFE